MTNGSDAAAHSTAGGQGRLAQLTPRGAAHAAAIAQRLTEGSMPCDGAWPAARTEDRQGCPYGRAERPGLDRPFRGPGLSLRPCTSAPLSPKRPRNTRQNNLGRSRQKRFFAEWLAGPLRRLFGCHTARDRPLRRDGPSDEGRRPAPQPRQVWIEAFARGQRERATAR
jgi:hypothetical protein